MTRKLAGIVGVAAIAGLALAASSASAQAQGGPGRGMQPRGPERMKQALGLSEQQANDAEALHVRFRRESIQRRADLQLARLDLRELLKAATLDDKAIAAKVRTLQDLSAAAVKARVDQQVGFLKLLTPEQRQKLEEFRAERPRGARPGERGRGGRGQRRMGPRMGAAEEPGDEELEDGQSPAALTPDARR
ncbi:MAG: Spy/CpxP family protein refolding chaperone [Vicinamibacteria bacterium]